MKYIAHLGSSPPFSVKKYDIYEGFEIPSATGSPLLRFWAKNPRLETDEDGFHVVVDDYLFDSGEIIPENSPEDNLIDDYYDSIERTLLDILER